MTGIIHFPTSSRRTRHVSRRALLAGAAGYAAAATFSPHASSQDASPGASPAAGIAPPANARERLTEMLRLVPPDLLGGPDPNTWLFSWLDLESHLTALGNPDLFDPATDSIAIMTPIMIDDPLLREARMPDMWEFFGFSPFEVHRTLVAGASPGTLTLYAGGFDASTLPEIWEAAGYEHKSGMAGDYWTIGENAEMDMASPIQRLAIARMNNLAVLDGGTVVAAPMAEFIEFVQANLASGDASAADDPAIAALVDTLPESAVNVIALPGAGLEASSITPENPGMETTNSRLEDLIAESDDAVGPMPVSEMALFGVTAGAIAPPTSTSDVAEEMPPQQGDPGEAHVFVHLLLGSEVDAEAAAGVVLWRIENLLSPVAGYAYIERLAPLFAPADAVQGSVAAMSFATPDTVASWHQLLGVQDLWPFVWVGSE